MVRISKRESVAEEEKDDRYAENYGEDCHPQTVMAFEFSHFLQQQKAADNE